MIVMLHGNIQAHPFHEIVFLKRVLEGIKLSAGNDALIPSLYINSA
jgi:hypothetical protein